MSGDYTAIAIGSFFQTSLRQDFRIFKIYRIILLILRIL